MGLSPKQQKMLDFIREFVLENGYPPSVREIGRAMGISSTSVVKYNLDILERAGHIQRDRTVSRVVSVYEGGPLRKPTVFISYSHADSKFVDWLADKLKASGVAVWIDKWRIKVGDSITQKINEGIGASDFLIVVLSCASVNSKWVREELNAATIRNIEEDKHAFILPVLIEECEIPSLLRHRKYASFKDDPEQAFQDLLEAIQPQKSLPIEPEEKRTVASAQSKEAGPTRSRLPFEPEMILIPAGKFLMGSDPQKDEDAWPHEQPQHTVYLPDYYLAKTPVTNAQYAAFVGATSYRLPRDWEGGKPARGRYTHPVVFVSWNDAVAYCQWLSRVTGKPYRLPSEAEWEKGARGTDGHIYPWGNQWDEERCNSRERSVYDTTLADTTPVGAYPEGASPYGLLDMVGNVWEWTRSIYKRYPYDPTDGREDLEASDNVLWVVRGGSWYEYQELTRCASRKWHRPDVQNGTLGFRVVVSADFP